MTNPFRRAAIGLVALPLAASLAVVAPSPVSATGATNASPSATRVQRCDWISGYEYDSMKVRGMTCARGKRLVKRADRKWLQKFDGSPFRTTVGNFRCQHSGEWVSNGTCRSKSAPKKRWFWFHAGE